jgi:hypothetical protein
MTTIMNRAWLGIGVLAVAIILVVVAWLPLPPGAPMYKGRPLTGWVRDGYGASSTQEELDQANEAVRAVGTNALAFWLDLLSSTNDSKVTELGNSIFGPGSAFHRPEASERGYWAFCALSILGTNAKPAMPKLTELLDYRYVAPNEYAAIIMAGLGPAGVEMLTNVLANTNAPMRFWLAATLGGWNGKPPNYVTLAKRGEGLWEWPEPVMKAIVPALIRCLQDRHDNVRIFAAQSLGELGQDAATTVPALAEYLAAETGAMGRRTGLKALARFGEAAKPAWPVVAGLLHDADLQTRRSATHALDKIDPQAGMK